MHETCAPPGGRSGSRKRRQGARWLLFGCGGLFVTALAAGFGYLSWANAPLPPAEPDPLLPYPNAYDICVAALANRPALSASSPLNQPDTSSLAELRRLLAAPDPGGEKVRAVLALPYRNPPWRDLLGSFPEVLQYRDLSRRWTAEARVLRLDGKPEAALDRCLDAMELGSRIGVGAGILHHYTGIACQVAPLYQAELTVPRLSAAAARAAGRRLDRILRQNPSAADLGEVERRAGLYALRHIFSRDYRALKAVELNGSALSQPLLMALYPKLWTYENMDTYYRASIAELKKPYRSRTQPEIPRDPFCSLLLPALNSASGRLTHRDALLSLFRLELALQEYRQTHGRYPPRLEQLTPAMLGALPSDPFTNQPFRYRLTGKGYLLYSLSFDGKDDGGVSPARKNRAVGGPGDLVAGKLQEKE